MIGNLRHIKHKFHAQSIEHDGIKFSSKLEAKYYEAIKFLQKTGEILFFLRQVPFHLGKSSTYRADFMLFFTDGKVEIWEVKGFETKEWKLKKKLVEEKYPVKIKVLK